ncbi:MAG: aminopeptidase [Micavibrio aeruginosavorus]|uniref:Aminopeptidase n=1 Tax=Micavibrio aeruginosavorus TaxID=349221 RepID=A0A7T5R3V4_9BACT|nr:MAG: aminopeptidase [Micavibrio aeruginosavorus]
MKIKNLGPYYVTQIAHIAALAKRPGLWQEEATALLPHLKRSYKRSESDELLQTLSRAQRLEQIIVAGLENQPEFKYHLEEIESRGWADFTAPPVPIKLHESIANKLYNAKRGSGDRVLLRLGDGSRLLAPFLVNRCLKDSIPFVAHFVEPDFHALLINHTNDEGAVRLGQAFTRMTDGINKTSVARAGQPDRIRVYAHPDRERLYDNETASFYRKASTGALFYTLTAIPTRKDAQIDGIPYDDYIKLFFEMCDQPWDAITKAQEELIKEFNAASHVRITNDDGTDVSMSLVDHDGSHFTFCNSVIAKNVPGSEIFSAPRRDSVNGIVVANGKFTHDRGVIENLTMTFKDGELVDYKADRGIEAFRRAVTMDEGARYIGELGIGTNPHLKRHVMNGLLVEKIGGSFHLALGRPYSYKEYGGRPVKVDNGGQSDLHWDITTLLHGKGGCIYLDDRKIMDNGVWISKKYDVLNRGWESIPRDKRPDYWKDYYNKPKGP